MKPLTSACLFIFCSSIFLSAQNKGTVYVYWGYNQSQYSKSDIHVWGSGYDFTLYDVVAHDRPTKELSTYFDLSQLTVPQFVLRGGFYITDKIHISGGYDHMKYVVKQYQPVKIKGYIEPAVSGTYYGNYNFSDITIQPDFFRFEHTNGLNYLSLEADWQEHLLKKANGKLRLNIMAGLGLAAIYPRSEAIFFEKKGADIFHTSGYGINLHTALKLDIGKYFFLRTGIKGGFINMPDVLTYDLPNHGASHSFWFLQEYTCFGLQYNIYKLLSKQKAMQE
jgi:hypothetical protein